jgi:hypothetical protein
MEAAAHPSPTSAKHLDVFDRFLAEEAALRLPDVDLSDRARFHRIVRQCALAWSRHPKAAFHIVRNRHALALAFDGPVEGKNLTVLTFRSAAEFGEYRFHALQPSAIPQTLSPPAKTALQRLRDLYTAALPGVFDADGAVGVAVKRHPSIDFLPIIDEARRVLDEGNQDFPAVDLRELMVVPAEHARLFVGKTNVVPVVRPKIETPPPASAVRNHKASGQDDDEDEDSDSNEDESKASEESSTTTSSAPAKASKGGSKSKAVAPVAAAPAKASKKTTSKKVASPVAKTARPAPKAKKPVAKPALKKPPQKAKAPASKPASKPKATKKSR